MKEIKVGASSEKTVAVTEERLAVTVGSGDLKVFATPMMIALMENAAASAVSEYLEGEETTVGTFMGTSHSAATPLGMNVTARATVTAVNGREIEFSVEAFDECGKIGEGTHRRFVVYSGKFMAKTNAKLEKQAHI